MTAAPHVLLVTSHGSPSAAVTPVLAALEATEMRVRAIDVGRVGSRSEGAVDRMLRALVGELSERRLSKELASNPPDVVVAFDPGSTQALTVARDAAQKPAPVVAVVDELAPGKGWASTDADRYLVVDDEAAVALSDHGVEGERIMPVGAFCSFAFASAGSDSRNAVRDKFKLGSGPVVVVEVAGLGYDQTSQVALQLSLADAQPLYLFDAGDDSEAALALRRQVPTLGMRAKLFGKTSEAPAYWRAADVVVARPSARAVGRAIAVGARFVSFSPEGSDAVTRAKAIEQRRIGAQAQNALLLSSALEPLLRLGGRSDRLTGVDGAGNAADVVWIVGSERNAVIDERLAEARAETRARVKQATSAARAAAEATAPAGGLEDLSGAAPPPADVPLPDPAEFAQLRAELETRMGQVSKTVFAARETAEKWEKRILDARRKKNDDLAAKAQANADAERARMHESLAEMAQLQKELKELEKAELQAKVAAANRPPPSAQSSTSSSSSFGTDQAPPPRRSGPSVDELLEQMKRRQGSGTSSHAPSSGKKKKRKRKASTVDDELAALKRKMAADKGKKR